MKDSLKKSEELFEKTFLMSPDAVNINRMSDGLYVLINEGFTAVTGYTKDEISGKTSFDIDIWVNPEDRDLLVRGLKTEGKVTNLETRFRMKSGELRTGILSAVIIDLDCVPHILSWTKDISERKQIENALNDSETRYRELVDLAPDGILLGNHDGIMTGANSNMLRIVGRTLNELVGSDISILFSPEELERVPLKYDILHAGEPVTSERNILRPNGSVVPVETHTKMMPNGSYQLICHDISDRRNSEAELKKLSRAVEQSPAGIVITDPNGTIEYVNPKLCESTGYTKEELIGKNPRIWSSHEKPIEEYREFWITILGGNDWKGVFHNRKKNGELFWESATVSPIKNEKNEITHFLGIKEDITLRKHLEEKTLASEKRYRELFLSNPIPAYIFYEDTLEFIEVNDAAVFNYGYSRDEFSKMTLKDIRHLEDLPAFMDMVKGFGKDEFHTSINPHMRKGGNVFPADISSHALPEKNGRRTRLVMAIDITQRVKAAEQMNLAMEKIEASDRLKTTFLNNISHEVRTPLNEIVGFTELIRQPDLTEREKEDSISMLIESSDRLLNTITNYMDISLLTSGSMTVNNKDFFPQRIFETLYEHYKAITTDKNFELRLDIPLDSEDLSLRSDEEILHKIMSHLLDNAIKFTEKGFVHFGFKRKGYSLEFFVVDTGLGISKNSINTIFDRFIKGDHAPVKQSEGSGLGLPIARGMIEMIGGTIRVESEVGVGSTFSFIIPLSLNIKQESISLPKKIEKEMNIPLILVAEDDETNFYYLNALLRMETNATVLHASNGREAIDLFRKNPDIGLILMDIKMPGIDGLEATRQIKEINKDVPIIAITAYAMSGDKERVLAAGCDDYLSKPINKKNLLKKMSELYKV